MTTVETYEKMWSQKRTRKSWHRNRRYKEDPNGNFGTEKYDNQNKNSNAKWTYVVKIYIKHRRVFKI